MQHHNKAALLPEKRECQQTFEETLLIDQSTSNLDYTSRTLKLPDMLTFFQIRKG